MFQMSNSKWRSKGVKSLHQYNLDNNTFQVKNVRAKISSLLNISAVRYWVLASEIQKNN